VRRAEWRFEESRLPGGCLGALLYHWLSNILALFVASWAIPAMTYGESWWTLVVAALVFALVNAVVRPVAIVLGIVAIVVTLGLGLFFVNMGMLWITSQLVGELAVGGFPSYVGATLVVWAVNVAISALLRPRRHAPPHDGGAPA
jgi:putative membrane protein